MKLQSSYITFHALYVARPMLIARTLTDILIASYVTLERLEKSHHHHAPPLRKL